MFHLASSHVIWCKVADLSLNKAVYCSTAGNCMACQCVELKVISFSKTCCYNSAFGDLFGPFVEVFFPSVSKLVEKLKL